MCVSYVISSLRRSNAPLGSLAKCANVLYWHTTAVHTIMHTRWRPMTAMYITRCILMDGLMTGLPSADSGVPKQGLVTCVKRDHRGEEAHVVISDLKNVKIKIPWAQAQQYLISKGPSASHWLSRGPRHTERTCSFATSAVTLHCSLQ